MNARHYFRVVLYKTYADLKAESARTYISFLWWILDPLLYMAVFYLVFGVLLKQGTDSFVTFLLIGLVFWKWFSSSLQHALNSIAIHRGLIQQVYLPKYLFPFITILTDLTKFFVVLVILLLFLLATKVEVTPVWVNLPLLILCQLILVTGCACFLAAITPFFPDIRYITDSALTLLMFGSGVFFDTTAIPETYQDYFFLNPMAAMLGAYRAVLLEGRQPNWEQVTYVGILGFITLIVALWVLKRFDRAYPRLALT